MNLNLKATDQNTYDAIVVGSGISGGWAAMELTKQGIKTLLIERGRNVEHIKDYPTANLKPWEYAHRGRLTASEAGHFQLQNKNYAVNEFNQHFYVNETEQPYVQTLNQAFAWARGNQVGGRSLTWGRQCYRWSDLDFTANLKEGIGVDWPIRYQTLAPWYEHVEKFVGIAGQSEHLAHLPDSVFLPPFALNCVELNLKAKLEAAYPDRYLIHARVAHLTQYVAGRGQCQARNQCDQGCPYGGYFASNSATIPQAQQTGNLTLRTDSIVTKVIYDETSQRAKGVEVLDTATGQTVTYFARIIFLNASTIPTTTLLLNSTSARFPNGMGNDSGELGRNLMTHFKTGLRGIMPGFADRYTSGRRPSGAYIPRFRNVASNDAPFLRGYNYQGGAARLRPSEETVGFGADWKELMSRPADDWQVGFAAFGEQLPHPDNRVKVSGTVRDKWGLPVPEIDWEWKANELQMAQDSVEQGLEMMAQMGCEDLHGNVNELPKSTVHEMGTARMGRNPNTSVLNGFNQLHAVKNVFVTDGACMASSSCVNPSLTYMALTARACAHAAEEMKRGNL